MNIKNASDLRCGYELLSILSENLNHVDDPAKVAAHIEKLKREIRLFVNRPTGYDRRIIHDDGIDGYISLERLPDDISSLEEAKRFFEDFMELHCTPSMYDCTGQAFTNWFKVFRRNGAFYAYHSVSFDL